MKNRIEKDTMGAIEVPNDAYWGAQTERSRENFAIDLGNSTMPKEIIYALALLKKACASANNQLKLLDDKKTEAILKVCDEILDKKLDAHFPLIIWQTGSGTQTNMNLNEVIANRGTELLDGDFRTTKLIHPNDDVNKGQSSNDTFPTAMKMVICMEVIDKLLPSMKLFLASLKAKEKEFAGVIKVGRTHLQDATPVLVSQEFSGYAYMLENNIKQIELAESFCRELAIGGTAVGTGINAHKEFGKTTVNYLNKFTNDKYKFLESPNKFHALSAHDPEVFLMGAIKSLAMNLYKITSDLRFAGSGPRAGIGEYLMPENEPGSSIMPGKVNPTQVESLTMICCQVLGNDVAVSFGASQGHFQLNVYNPMIITNIIRSIHMLADGMHSFVAHCLDGLTLNMPVISHNLENSLMLATALNPIIGYENAAKIAKYAHHNNLSLKQAATKLNILSEEEFDKAIDPKKMV